MGGQELKNRLLPIMGSSQWMSTVELRLINHCVKATTIECYEATAGEISDPDVVVRLGVCLSQSQR